MTIINQRNKKCKQKSTIYPPPPPFNYDMNSKMIIVFVRCKMVVHIDFMFGCKQHHNSLGNYIENIKKNIKNDERLCI